MQALPLNGIDATTGAPLLPELDEAALARLALGQALDPAAQGVRAVTPPQFFGVAPALAAGASESGAGPLPTPRRGA